MAEVYSHMIFLKKEEINQIRKLDPILNNKISYIENRIKKLIILLFLMIKKIKASTSEKFIFIFLILLVS